MALAPAGVDALVRNGHTVYLQSGAGDGSHFTDEQYKQVGAKIVYSAEEVFTRSELVAKVGRVSEEEASYLQEDQIIFSFLNLAVVSKQIITTMMEKVIAIGLELIEDEKGLPVLHSMSEIAGQLAVQAAENLLESTNDISRGVLLGDIPGVAPAAVVILGAGVVGTVAAQGCYRTGSHSIKESMFIPIFHFLQCFFKDKQTKRYNEASLFSSFGIKWLGKTNPSIGCCHLTKASKPTILLL